MSTSKWETNNTRYVEESLTDSVTRVLKESPEDFCKKYNLPNLLKYLKSGDFDVEITGCVYTLSGREYLVCIKSKGVSVSITIPVSDIKLESTEDKSNLSQYNNSMDIINEKFLIKMKYIIRKDPAAACRVHKIPKKYISEIANGRFDLAFIDGDNITPRVVITMESGYSGEL